MPCFDPCSYRYIFPCVSVYISRLLFRIPLPRRGSSADDVTAACTHLIAAKDGTDKSRLLTRLAPRAHKVNVNWLHHCAAHFQARAECWGRSASQLVAVSPTAAFFFSNISLFSAGAAYRFASIITVIVFLNQEVLRKYCLDTDFSRPLFDCLLISALSSAPTRPPLRFRRSHKSRPRRPRSRRTSKKACRVRVHHRRHRRRRLRRPWYHLGLALRVGAKVPSKPVLIRLSRLRLLPRWRRRRKCRAGATRPAA
jgi:hypothetical protein